MIRQQEIREQIAKIVANNPKPKEIDYETVDIVLAYESSKGAVLKVDKDIVHWCQLCEFYEEGTDLVRGDWAACNNSGCSPNARKWKLKAGFGAYEPLIEG